VKLSSRLSRCPHRGGSFDEASVARTAWNRLPNPS
jgi:hypothetical protein